MTEALRATPEPWQREALEALPTAPRIAIRSGHGVGKSVFLAWVVLWYMLTHFPAKVGTTAPTEHQLEDHLWSEIAAWFRRLDQPFQDYLKLTYLSLEVVGRERESFARGTVSRPENPDAFAGFHSDNMLLIGDEASGIPEASFEVALGAMSTAGARLILTGNPTQGAGFFFDCFHKMRSRWWTRRVSSEDVPRATHHIEDVIARYGIDSNVYRVRVLGEFPTNADDTVIPLDLCEAAVIRQVEPTKSPVRWGLDVARFGDDRTALIKRQGNHVLEAAKTWANKDTMQVAGLVKLEYENADPKPEVIAVDVIGIGAGVVDRLKEHNLPVAGINVAEAPAIDDGHYLRMRDELWFKAREWLAARDCKLPKDEQLIAELTAPRYAITSAGKIKVESKDEMKKRGINSPDIADALCLTFAGVSVARHMAPPEPPAWVG